jgi:two-component system, OmpR family, KDP operon response regulator KdpE
MKDSGQGLLILVVDDDDPVRHFLDGLLTLHGYRVIEAANGLDALKKVQQEHPGLIILDLGLPDLNGIEVTRRLRAWTQTPIIILTVREQDEDKIRALDIGADDYLTKPFSSGELMARIRAALRHGGQNGSLLIVDDGFLHVDFVKRTIKRSGAEVNLTPTEYDLLRLMVMRAGMVITQKELLREVWGEAYDLNFHLLRVNISTLRQKIEPDPSRPQYVITEPGIGYCFRSMG